MPDDPILSADTKQYILGLMQPEEPLFAEMRRFAEEVRAPIAQPESAQLLSVLVSIAGPQKILEIGTAIGYSALVMQKACRGGADIVTVEQDFDMVRRAKEYIQKSGYADKIKIIGGDALEVLPNLTGSYDFIFLDAAKAHYLTLLPDMLRVLRPGGLLVSDNVLYQGMLASRALFVRRKVTIVKRLQKYLEAISNHPRLKTTILPVGDGISISYKLT